MGASDDGPTEDDGALFAAALDGDERAAGRLVHRHASRLHACAMRLVGDEEAAADIVQEVFVRAFRVGRSFRFESALSTWLHAMTLNRCRDALRRAATRGHLRLDDPRADVPAGAPDPLGDAEARDREARLAAAVAALPDEMREVIVLRFTAGLSYDETADVLGCTAGTVASRLHRALRRLGRELAAAGLTRESI